MIIFPICERKGKKNNTKKKNQSKLDQMVFLDKSTGSANRSKSTILLFEKPCFGPSDDKSFSALLLFTAHRLFDCHPIGVSSVMDYSRVAICCCERNSWRNSFKNVICWRCHFAQVIHHLIHEKLAVAFVSIFSRSFSIAFAQRHTRI